MCEHSPIAFFYNALAPQGSQKCAQDNCLHNPSLNCDWLCMLVWLGDGKKLLKICDFLNKINDEIYTLSKAEYLLIVSGAATNQVKALKEKVEPSCITEDLGSELLLFSRSPAHGPCRVDSLRANFSKFLPPPLPRDRPDNHIHVCIYACKLYVSMLVVWSIPVNMLAKNKSKLHLKMRYIEATDVS